MKNLSNPNRHRRIAIVDYRTAPESIKSLENMGLHVIKATPVDQLYEAVNGHPDMQIHKLDNNSFLCAPEVYEYYKNKLPSVYTLICGSIGLNPKYPYDIPYNTAVIGDHVICNARYTAPEILAAYKKKKVIDVHQGYAKCSIAVINNNAAITADAGIYKALTENGISVLKISPGHIKLTGLSYGFIGGSCGMIDEQTLAVNGSITLHPDAEKIIEFCTKHGVDVVSLNNDELYDIGSIIVSDM